MQTFAERREIRDEVADHREPDHEIDPLFVNRWSPRAMTGEPLEEIVHRGGFE